LWNRNRRKLGTVTFCPIGTEIHYGSGTGIGSGLNIKWNKNSIKENNFLENNAASDIEKARFCAKFLLLVNWINIVWIRNRNQNFSKVGTETGTATNHYSSTTLKPTSYLTTGPYIIANFIELQ
jgi:hypothetical protein